MRGMNRLLRALLLSVPILLLAPTSWAMDPVVVGSKRFTESYILGEIVRQTLAQAGVPAEHRQGLGNTGILEQALASGAVDVYPEYTGTIVRELLKREWQRGNPTLEELNAWLAPRGLKAAVPLGFNNTYALALRESDAERLGMTRISDLARLPAGCAQARPVARIPGARRRLAGAAARLRACRSVPARRSTTAWPTTRWRPGRWT